MMAEGNIVVDQLLLFHGITSTLLDSGHHHNIQRKLKRGMVEIAIGGLEMKG